MFKEIGSNFFLDAETISSYELKEKTVLFNEDAQKTVFSSSGRGAISLVLDQIQPKSGVALLPIYTCGSVIKPFLNHGYSVEYFDVETDLSVDWGKLEESISVHKPDVLLFHSYFGFDTHRTIHPHIPSLRRSGITVIEDQTHSLLSGFEKSAADYHVASLRKWLPIPDGGFVFSYSAPLEVAASTTLEEMVKINLEAFQKKYDYTKSLDVDVKNEYRGLFTQAEQLLDANSGFHGISEASLRIIQNTDYCSIKQSRRDNYQFLLSKIMELDLIKPVFAELPEAAVPLFFPVFIEMERTELRNHMAANEMYLPVHWGVPKRIQEQLTPNAEYIYSHILSIPLDQRYTPEDMERLVDSLKSYLHTLKAV